MFNFRSLIVFFLCISIINVLADVTKEDAKLIVINDIIDDCIDDVNAFMDSTIVTTSSYVLTSYKSITNPYNQSWLFFIDDHPTAFWEHPCRYIFLNVSDSSYQILSDTVPVYEYRVNLEEVSIGVNFPNYNYSTTPPNLQRTRNPDPHKWAVFLSGHTQLSTWNGMSQLYCALTTEEGDRSYNFSDSTIIVLSWDAGVDENHNQYSSFYGPDDEGTNHIDGACDKASIDSTFNYLEDTLGPEDMLFVYITDHGGVDNCGNHFIQVYDEDVGIERYYDSRLADAMDSLNCAQTIIVMQPCHSGGFIPELQKENRIIITATDSDTLAYGDHPDSPLHPAHYFPEFSYFWNTSIARKHADSYQAPWEVNEDVGDHIFFYPQYQLSDFDPDVPQQHEDLNPNIGNLDGVTQMKESFQYAKAMDAFVEDFYIFEDDGRNEYPQMYYGIPFEEDICSLNGLSGEIENTQSVFGNFQFGGDIEIQRGVTLTFETGSHLFLNNDSKIIVNSNANLILQDSVIVKGKCNDNSIIVNGSIEIGDYVVFTSVDDNEWGGISINSSDSLVINKLTVEDCEFSIDDSETLNLNDPVFTVVSIFLCKPHFCFI
ncbi:MAG: hypothetical protein APR54_11060 [Candidatus Cloacimonas sp. SDB]|nr:MAG: hypothetical protein APR54_11060 [Candidatus Cloacimonas sp. SDB]